LTAGSITLAAENTNL